MDRSAARRAAFSFLGNMDEKIRTKFSNICGKTGQYDVPGELFQKRTSRKNRVMMPWKDVKNNGLTMAQLETFSGGVVVEFVNEDYFLPENQTHPVFIELKNKIGGDEIVSAIITIRSESGSSSSAVQREYFSRLLNNTSVMYRGNEVVLNADNYMDYVLRRDYGGGTGNENWSGFLYVCIRGGQQDTTETHLGENLLLFNPACEFATAEVCLDIDLVMAYYALISVDRNALNEHVKTVYDRIVRDVRQALSESNYDSPSYTGNLLDYCDNHPSVKMVPGQLTDPIQVEPIHIEDFAVDNKEDSRNLDFTHDEAVNKGKYYWDEAKQCVLSPARPTNVFWSKHLSNMMQQNFSLSEYFEHEEEIIARRRQLLSNR